MRRSFKAQFDQDWKRVFCNVREFAEHRTVEYDGEQYIDIPVVMSSLTEKERNQLQSDHAQGLYLVSLVLYCSLGDLDGNQPEKGARLKIKDQGDSGFFREFYVASSACQMGILQVELEAIDE